MFEGKQCMKLKIESSNITLTVVNDATGQQIIKTYKKNSSIGDVINSLCVDNFLASPPDNFYWECQCNSIIIGVSDILDAKLKSGDTLLFCCKEFASCGEIQIAIVRVSDNISCDIDVPLDATIGDVIVGLINEGFLEPDYPSSINTLCSIDCTFNWDSVTGKYCDRSKTIKEYGWQYGQTIKAVRECVAYGCPTAKELPGLVPECMLAHFDTFSFDVI